MQAPASSNFVARVTPNLASLLLITVCVAAPTTGRAQIADEMTILRKRPAVSGLGGAKLAEGLYLNLGVLTEAGYDSNIFYSDVRREQSTTILVTPSAQISNSPREGEAAARARFHLGTSLVYRTYLEKDSGETAKRTFNPTFIGALEYGEGRGIAVSVQDQLSRSEEPPYSPDADLIERWHNHAVLEARFTHGGRRLQNTLRYSNTLERFESPSAKHADRMSSDLMLDAAWKWLPKTSLYLETALGYVAYLEGDRARAQGKADSLPFRLIAGLRGLWLVRVSLDASLGYAGSHYGDSIPDPSGMSNFWARATASYYPSATRSMSVAYERRLADSPFVGDYLDADTIAASATQQVRALVVRIFYKFESRRYRGLDGFADGTRRDFLQHTGVVGDYFIERWCFIGASISAHVNRSDFGERGGYGVQGLDYTKAEALGRVGVSY